MPISFHLDEHIPGSIASGLIRRGVVVSTSAQSGLLGSDDECQLAYATSYNRVLVTQDADFLRLHARGVRHSGIVYCRQGTVRHGYMLRQLLLIYDLLTPEEMAGKIEFL